jgi:FAD/FMN-containing dehydrogenase
MISNGKKLSTYAETYSFQPRYVVDCQSVQDVRAAILEAGEQRMRVRAMGFGNSWAPHLPTPDVCLKIGKLNKINRIDTNRMTVSVDAGMRLGDLSMALAARGLTLPSLSFLPDVSIGGAVATATHGTSLQWGTLSDFVSSMEVVLPSGEVKTFGPLSPPEELRAARVAIGMLGVIVRLELQVIEIPWVRYAEHQMPLRDFIAQLPAILARYAHVWAHWTFGDNLVRVECLEAQKEAESGYHRYGAIWQPSARLAVRLLNRFGISTSLLLQMRDRYRWALRPKKLRMADPALLGQAGKVFMSMQYGVPMSQLEHVVEKINRSEFAKTNPGRAVEFKFLKGTNLSFLGPNADHDSVLFNLFWLVDEQSKMTVFDSFEEQMRELRAAPHWGKFHRAPDIPYMQSAFPHWKEFERVRSKYDPRDALSIFNPEPSCPKATAKSAAT